MEREALKAAMKRSISEVLETMFFLPLEFPEGQGREPEGKEGNGSLLVTKLSFHGPFSGDFLFFIPEDLTLSLTAGFLGVEEAKVTRAHVTDMVKEIVNMIAGNTFSILDDKAVFDLTIPEILDSRGPEPGEAGVYIPIRTIGNSLALQVVLPV
ncbi:MAG: chemotaxis protein CheX [Thermodesulfobacteriota bacterium]